MATKPRHKAAQTRALKAAEAKEQRERQFYSLFPDEDGSFLALATDGLDAAIATVLENYYTVNPQNFGPGYVPTEPDITGDAGLWLAGRLQVVFLAQPKGPPRVVRLAQLVAEARAQAQ